MLAEIVSIPNSPFMYLLRIKKYNGPHTPFYELLYGYEHRGMRAKDPWHERICRNWWFPDIFWKWIKGLSIESSEKMDITSSYIFWGETDPRVFHQPIQNGSPGNRVDTIFLFLSIPGSIVYFHQLANIVCLRCCSDWRRGATIRTLMSSLSWIVSLVYWRADAEMERNGLLVYVDTNYVCSICFN